MPRSGFGQATIPGRPQELRRSQTSAEEIVWERLRARQLYGLKFRRQFPIAIYITDFCCYEHRLVVELDGAVHAEPEQILHDQNRDAYLRSCGYKVLRFANRTVFEEPDQVLRRIVEAAGVGHLVAYGATPDGLTPDPSPIALPPNRERGAPTLQEGESQRGKPPTPDNDNAQVLLPPLPGEGRAMGEGGQGGEARNTSNVPNSRTLPQRGVPPSPGGWEGDGRGGLGG